MSSSRNVKLSAFSRLCVAGLVLCSGAGGCSGDHAGAVVIGGGPAGLAAAIEAAAGTRVVLVEKALVLGGSARYAAGITAVPGPEGAGGLPAAYAARVQEDVIDWTGDLGQTWEPAHNPLSDGLVLRKPVGGGVALVGVLERAASLGSVEVWRETGAVGLRAREGWLRAGEGWTVELDDGREISATSVVVATGGFAGSLARVRAALGEDGPLLRGAPEWADGSGGDMVVAAGGTRASPEQVLLYGHGVPHPDRPGRAIMIAQAPGARWFDGARRPMGAREVRGEGGAQLWKSPGKVGWVVFGEAELAKLQLVDPLAGRSIDGATLVSQVGLSATEPRLMAAKTGIEASELRGLSCPCAALPIQATTGKSLTGVVTDAGGRVLDRAGKPIPGLFAAGEVAGFGGGRHPPVDSTMIAGAILSGRDAGRSIAAAR